MYKSKIHKDVLNAYSKFDVTIQEFTADTLGGFTQETAPYSFLQDVSFFPCIMCVKTSVLNAFENGTLDDDIFDRLFVWNGMCLAQGNSKRIRTITPSSYGIQISEFERFYNDFLNSKAYTGYEKRVFDNSRLESRSQTPVVPTSVSKGREQPGSFNSTNRMYVCHGIRVITPVTK
jgi:hypothetical protein